MSSVIARFRRPRATSLTTLALCVAALAAGPGAAQAGTYEVRQCDSGGAQLVGTGSDWAGNSVNQYAYANGCANSGPELSISSLVVDPFPPSDARYVVDAPPATKFKSFSGSFRATVSSGFAATFEAYDGPSLVTGLTPGSSFGTLSFSNQSADQVRMRLVCSTPLPPGCTFSPGSAMRGRDFAYTLDDSQSPGVPALGGSLFNGNWQRGTSQGTWSADDAGGGVKRAELNIGGLPTINDSTSCSVNPNTPTAFSRKLPCPTPADGAFTVDTTQLADGTYLAGVLVRDAGDNTKTANVNVKVDNTAPGPPLNLRILSQNGDRVDVGWALPGQGQGSPIAAYRYKLGAPPTSLNDGQLVQSGSLDALANLQIPAGKTKLYVWLKDEAGNTGDPNADGASITLTFEPPFPVGTQQFPLPCLINGEPFTRKAAIFARFRNLRGGRALLVPFGKRVRVRGRLTTASGAGIRNAKIRAFVRFQGTRKWVDRGGVRSRTKFTDRHGNFTYIAPIDAARKVRLSFFACENSTLPIANAYLDVRVRAGVKLRSARAAYGPGRRAHLTGRLLGQPFPKRPVRVGIQARSGGGAWRTVATLRTRRKFKLDVRFPNGAGGYEFRAVMRKQAGYPYETGRSRTVRARAL